MMDCTCVCLDCIGGRHCGGEVNERGICHEFERLEEEANNTHFQTVARSRSVLCVGGARSLRFLVR